MRAVRFGAAAMLGISILSLPWQIAAAPVSSPASAAQLQPAPVPIVQPETTAELDSLSALGVVVIDVPSAAVLYARHPDAPRAPASTTKLMTALVARELYQLEDVVTASLSGTVEGNVMGVEPNEPWSVKNLLYAMLISSANDAAEVLAQAAPGGRAAFIDRLTQKTAELHLTGTVLTNPAGLDTEYHQMTPRDLGVVAREIMKDDVLRQIVATPNYIISNDSNTRNVPLTTTNQLLGVTPGVVGIKTGTTDLAGQTLVTLVERDGRQVVIVVMGSSDRYADTLTIIDWVFSRVEWRDVRYNG
jgi:serine-type D-Ala-D-Ala carboxypeptidase (penicillin-binding protein 5/6)